MNGGHRNEKLGNEETARPSGAEGQYQGMIFTLTVLGGDWVRDAKGKHRVFLTGESSRDTDEYTNKED